jgi:hypothetical protein
MSQMLYTFIYREILFLKVLTLSQLKYSSFKVFVSTQMMAHTLVAHHLNCLIWKKCHINYMLLNLQ